MPSVSPCCSLRSKYPASNLAFCENGGVDFPFHPDERFILHRHYLHCMSHLTCRQRWRRDRGEQANSASFKTNGAPRVPCEHANVLRTDFCREDPMRDRRFAPTFFVFCIAIGLRCCADLGPRFLPRRRKVAKRHAGACRSERNGCDTPGFCSAAHPGRMRLTR
jgi:hypothetical protein